jgi:flagellar biogenesis protein FliO
MAGFTEEKHNIKDRHEIQKTSWSQMLIVLGFIAFIAIAVSLLQEKFSEKPQDLFKIIESSQSK